jgi:hypothetical protein
MNAQFRNRIDLLGTSDPDEKGAGASHMSSMTAFRNLPNGEGSDMDSWPM